MDAGGTAPRGARRKRGERKRRSYRILCSPVPRDRRIGRAVPPDISPPVLCDPVNRGKNSFGLIYNIYNMRPERTTLKKA